MAGMLEGKIAVVTGAGGGIGREIALAMARAGAKVVINDVGASLSGEGQSATPAEETKRLIEQGGGAAAISTDSVAEWSSAQKIVQAAIDHFGGLDIVVNNAGVLRDQIFHRMTAEDWLAVISVHLNGSFFVSRAAADQYRKQESGAYVHITSTSGLIGNMGQANYASAKLGITALSKAIAIDMKRFNVRSNCLSPWAWSRMTQSIPARTEEERARVAKIQQMTPDKNAPMAVFLASDAARDVTGQVFGTRMNEIYLFSSPRPIRSLHRATAGPRRPSPSTPCRHCNPPSCRSTARVTFSPGTRSDSFGPAIGRPPVRGAGGPCSRSVRNGERPAGGPGAGGCRTSPGDVRSAFRSDGGSAAGRSVGRRRARTMEHGARQLRRPQPRPIRAGQPIGCCSALPCSKWRRHCRSRPSC